MPFFALRLKRVNSKKKQNKYSQAGLIFSTRPGAPEKKNKKVNHDFMEDEQNSEYDPLEDFESITATYKDVILKNPSVAYDKEAPYESTMTGDGLLLTSQFLELGDALWT